jgi:predicted AAA+ superfamily ATPase
MAIQNTNIQDIVYKRLIADEIVRYLPTKDIIVLHGARQVGKTCILYYLQNLLKEKRLATHFIDLEDSRYVRILDAGVEEFIRYLSEEGFDGSKYTGAKERLFVFIDEIQYLENPSPFMKIIADHYPWLKLIVSGSSSFQIKKKFTDSLSGRTVDFEVYNLSFTEFLLFKKYRFSPAPAYGLGYRKPNHRPLAYTEKKLQELKALYEEYVLFGGYPKIVLAGDVKIKEKYLQQIIDTYIKKDIRDLAGIKDVNKFNRLVEALASQSGQLLNVFELSNTCNIAKPTVENYLFLLEQTYVVKSVRPFSGNLRSELSKTPKIFFYDTGLMQMLWLKELPKEVIGQVFETSIFAELVKKYGSQRVAYWRTTDKKEIDFVLKKGKSYLPLEVKLNFAQFKASPIKYFKEKYHISEHRVVGLHGKVKDKQCIYPWQL